MKSFKQYVTEGTNEAVFTFGRFNPPTIGHEKLLDAVSKTAGSNKYFIFASQSQDSKKNPIQYETKIKFMRKMFPRHARNVILDRKVRNVFDIMVKLYDQGFNKMTMVVGSDRVKEFEKLAKNYNGQKGRHGFYEFDEINIVSAGERDPDSEGVSGMSASKMRAAAADNNFEAFSKGLPSGFKQGKELFNSVRKGMNLEESHDFRRHVQLETVSEEREAYIQGELFAEGDVVEFEENIGQIIMLGSNYVIVESADGSRHRKWISDVKLVERTDKDSDLPKKYVSGIDSKSTKQARARHFEKGAKMDDDNPAAYKPAPGDATAKTKPSKYTKKFKQMFGEETKLAGKTYDHLELCPGAISAFERNLEDDGKKPEEIRPAIDAVDHYLEVEAKVMKKGEATQADVDEISKRIEKAKEIIKDLGLKGHTYHETHLNKVKKKLKEELEEAVTPKQISDLEKFGDRLLNKFNIDIEFTRHFADRMNDARNNPDIAVSELQKLFKKIQRNKGRNIKKMGDQEAVIKDLSADLNLPVAIDYKPETGEFVVTNKTIMRKKDFKTPNKVLSYEQYESSFEDVMTESTKKALQNKAEKTGISYSILKKVFDRGVAAWRTGHRPGTTPTQWGLARVNSFATGGKTRTTTDADLWKKHKGK